MVWLPRGIPRGIVVLGYASKHVEEFSRTQYGVAEEEEAILNQASERGSVKGPETYVGKWG